MPALLVRSHSCFLEHTPTLPLSSLLCSKLCLFLHPVFSIDEDSPYNTSLGAVMAEDADGTAVQYSVSNDSVFQFNPNQPLGELVFVGTPADIDYETVPQQ